MDTASNFFSKRCLSIDLEVDPKKSKILKIAAIREDAEAAPPFRSGNDLDDWVKLDRYAIGCEYLLGHNLILFDLKHLQAVKPDLSLLQKPAIDTLWLNPLAFPKKPYHHLVKHYQNPKLLGNQQNDPLEDAQLTMALLNDQQQSFREKTEEALLDIFHWLTARGEHAVGFDAFFGFLRGEPKPSDSAAKDLVSQWLSHKACSTYVQELMEAPQMPHWELAYALAWISVSGSNSTMPPWVLYQCPNAARLVQKLRDTACKNPKCDWCRTYHNPKLELKRWFFDLNDFRPDPQDPETKRPMQEVIVESAMAHKHVLGVLPTGTGKSLCYQLPGLSRFHKTGALTVVISPLVALMADQVKGMEENKITCGATINGMLSLPERKDALDRVRLGDVGILLISPEQLRNRRVRDTLKQRQIGAWVIDEAHCLSKWGHDFRPDYRYLGRFIKERSGEDEPAPILALTATAKPEVKEDIVRHFREKLSVDLLVYDGGSTRDNLELMVVQTDLSRKNEDVFNILESDLLADQQGSAIVYSAFRRDAEEMAEFLRLKELTAAHYHSKLTPDEKKNTQGQFIDNTIRVIVATNAFGMGIDKPDVRLVIHADIPGSLENYIQEAGRAGRDGQPARCVLLFTTDDIEKQFGMSARSRLNRREISGILKGLRTIDYKNRRHDNRSKKGEVVATSGEILQEDEDAVFVRDQATDDTRVKTAISWLEDAMLLTREENHVRIFPSSLIVSSKEEAAKRIASRAGTLTAVYRKQLLDITQLLIQSERDEGVSTDEIMDITGLTSKKVQKALLDLEELGVANNDTALTAYVHKGVERSSDSRIEQVSELETTLIKYLREHDPDLDVGGTSRLHVRIACQRLRDDGVANPLPEQVLRILRGLAQDRREDDSKGSLDLRNQDSESVLITLRRSWDDLEKTAALRRDAAQVLLKHWLDRLPDGVRGVDLLAETTFGHLGNALSSDILLRHRSKDIDLLMHRSLMWLHEMEVIRLSKGLAIFWPAMTLRLEQSKPRRYFTNVDFEPLKEHYQNQVLQIHVVAEYARRGLQDKKDAERLSADYFTLEKDTFIERWMAHRKKEITRQTTPESWQKIVADLGNPHQKQIVADVREQQNLLVLAGPGSGKTRVLVHRIAYLIRAKRENPRGIIALSYNRHAAQEIKKRLHELIGKETRRVAIMTCHALAMRLVGISFSGRLETTKNEFDQDVFNQILLEATDLLEGKGLPEDEADDQRERLLAGFRWILVDEYQDIDAPQYNLISALAGRTKNDPDRKLTVFAVGDDDQNIYAFNGSSVEFIRRFDEDYQVNRRMYLVENYRSTKHIIDAANKMIEPASSRMKKKAPIQIDRARREELEGGVYQSLDPVAKGRVQVLMCPTDAGTQAITAINELERLSKLSSEWNWADCAVIARKWKYLYPIRTLCEARGIPVQLANEEKISVWKLRETQILINWLDQNRKELICISDLEQCLGNCPDNEWRSLLADAVDAMHKQFGDEITGQAAIEWFAEWSCEARRRPTGLQLLTAHSAKGLEFDHVSVLDGGWSRQGRGENQDVERRLYYVAMTRARRTLSLVLFDSEPHAHQNLTGARALITKTFLQDPAVLKRKSSIIKMPQTGLDRIYDLPSLGKINLGFAGRLHNDHHASIKAIQNLAIGDSLKIRKRANRWELLDVSGTRVGLMARDFEPKAGCRIVSASAYAVIVWRRDADAQEDYGVKRDRWEVVVPELVYEPSANP